ncbi:RNA-directed DNA polymerase, eukaryota, reverse transcriptase zinc-binding domain protein [Tanacetum coccineum]|uniref:RNA-directed DNA polymerase, eukaryota, reverse transcriptase zinc-binding domain protein n=1 Tax=Tanacetum coccineum TaxID=301880 RepID=A0ABQ5H3S2_9ASTR
MDAMTTKMCNEGLGSLRFARILIEANATKGLVDFVKVLYLNKQSSEPYVTKVKVEYDWKPHICPYCVVFGHYGVNCQRKEKEIKRNQDINEAPDGFVNVKNRKSNDSGMENNNNGIGRNMQQNNQKKPFQRKEVVNKFMYRQKQVQEMNVKHMKKVNEQQDKLNTPPGSKRKVWNVGESVIKDVRDIANKFSVLQEIEEDSTMMKMNMSEKCIVEKFVRERIQPSVIEAKEWTKEMTKYFKILSSQKTFLCTFIYAANRGKDRRELWKDLNMLEFQECINDIEMEDINWSGMHFTWTKSLNNPNATVLKKLDKGHDMFKMVKKLKALKPYLNKLNWKHGNLFDRVSDLKKKLHDVQDKIDKDLIKRFEYNEVADQFVNHFEGFLGTSPEVTKFSEEDNMLFEKRVSSKEADYMTREISNDEIKNALFDIEDNKAPGPDGFASRKLLGEVNATLISLVPKSTTPQKYLTLDQLHVAIAITDNILLVQEPLKGYNCANGPKRCSFKIDIQKAYDTVSWAFLEDIIRKFGFSRRMTDWIMASIANSKFSICVNGERYVYFKGGRGLRQGDPISPYIFTIVMEWLNLIMKDEIRKEKQFKFHFKCKQMRITYLCFADDLIMLCHGGVESIQTIKRALDKFSSMTGLYPNLGKCTMFCGSLDSDTKIAISTILPFKEGKLLVRYLGVPLVTKKIGIADCKQLVDKVYWGLVFLLLKSVINDIEKLFKRFFWNNGESCRAKKESLWVKWINVVKLKNKSVWDIAIDSKDSWGWKCILNLRNLVGEHMRSERCQWMEWPTDWMSKFPWLKDVNDLVLNDCSDKPIWVDNYGNHRNFSTTVVWKDIRRNGDSVVWKDIIWHTMTSVLCKLKSKVVGERERGKELGVRIRLVGSTHCRTFRAMYINVVEHKKGVRGEYREVGVVGGYMIDVNRKGFLYGVIRWLIGCVLGYWIVRVCGSVGGLWRVGVGVRGKIEGEGKDVKRKEAKGDYRGR